MKNVTAVTTPTDHVTTDVVQVGQEALVKNVNKYIYIDKLKDSTIQKTEIYILVECITTFSNVCQRKKWRRMQELLRKMSLPKQLFYLWKTRTCVINK